MKILPNIIISLDFLTRRFKEKKITKLLEECTSTDNPFTFSLNPFPPKVDHHFTVKHTVAAQSAY